MSTVHLDSLLNHEIPRAISQYSPTQRAPLDWQDKGGYFEADLEDFYGRNGTPDGVRFTVQDLPTCYRRVRYLLLIEICEGPNHEKWGCFDAQDQPSRNFHDPVNLRDEAAIIAWILLEDRRKRG